MHKTLGVLKSVQVRDIWPHESRDFSLWLSEHLPELSEALGLDLEIREREAGVGAFSLDILAHDVSRDRRVIIENQLERTDHDHLGKLITYAAGFDAPVIVWIATTFREEHRAAIDWLNQKTAQEVEVFAVVLQAVQIDDSRPAVIFNVLASPNNWQKTAAQAARGNDRSPDDLGLFQFFETLLQDERLREVFRKVLSASSRSYCVIERTHRYIEYSVAFSRADMNVEWWTNSASHELNVKIFTDLRAALGEEASVLNQQIQWDFVPGFRRQGLRVMRKNVDRNSNSDLEPAKEWAIDFLVAFRQRFEPLLSEIIAAAQLYVARADDVPGELSEAASMS